MRFSFYTVQVLISKLFTPDTKQFFLPSSSLPYIIRICTYSLYNGTHILTPYIKSYKCNDSKHPLFPDVLIANSILLFSLMVNYLATISFCILFMDCRGKNIFYGIRCFVQRCSVIKLLWRERIFLGCSINYVFAEIFSIFFCLNRKCSCCQLF